MPRAKPLVLRRHSFSVLTRLEVVRDCGPMDCMLYRLDLRGSSYVKLTVTEALAVVTMFNGKFNNHSAHVRRHRVPIAASRPLSAWICL